jgi:hypothetical protein
MPDFIQNTAEGLFASDAETIAQNVNDSMLAVFGDNYNTSPQTVAGQLLLTLTQGRIEQVNLMASYINQSINPDMAGGTALDALCALTGCLRIPPQTTTVIATISGSESTFIPFGTKAKTQEGNIFLSTTSAVIPSTGQIDISFESEAYGSIPCGPGELNHMVDGILGIDSISNAAAATLGRIEQSDDDLRRFRIATLGIAGRGPMASLSAGMTATAGVRSFNLLENISSSIAVISGVTMEPHSIYFCVEGGSDAAVAESIMRKKSVGPQFTNGASSLPVFYTYIEPDTGQDYLVKFDRPDVVMIDLQITLRQGKSSLNLPQFIPNYIMQTLVNNERAYRDGESWGVGKSVLPHEISAAIDRADPNITIVSTKARKNGSGGTFSGDEIPLQSWEIAKTELGYITVIVQ